MNPRDPDQPLDRLRAADPAADAPAVDLARVRAAVDARLGEEGPRASADHETRAVPDELARRRRRRVAPWLSAAAVGALLFTGGGYLLGTSGTGGADAAGADSAAAEEAAADRSMADSNDGAAEPGALAPGTAESGAEEDALSYPSGQRTVFTSSGLGSTGTTAHAYGLDASGVATAERVAQIAEAFGMTGTPTEGDGAWSLGSYDSGDPVLRVYPDGTVDYSDPALDPWRCEEMAEEGGGASGSTGCTDPSGDAPAPAQAEQLLREALTALGVDPDAYAVTADRGTEGPLAYVTADLLVDGTPTGVTIGAGVSPDGVANLWGTLAEPYDLGSYDVVSPEQAVERLMDPRFGGVSTDVLPMEIRDEDLAAESGSADAPAEDPDTPVEGPAATAPPAPIDPGASIPWPVRQVTITGAALGLQTLYTDSGHVLLVPTYTLTGADADGETGTWTVIAVADGQLDQG
ncbi:hypothetical protein [Ruania alba]|uniref:Uncharacterized protein n=1 Tax=Ruania alba TaxID=648782 RepID=A0A1H5MQK7_9MICO|nr:hypothetical protein [Ruania alba]SEE91649.1 hypothetical protein SAMN04488554_3566 [Ruania alba]